jgi:hypothetical protein
MSSLMYPVRVMAALQQASINATSAEARDGRVGLMDALSTIDS